MDNTIIQQGRFTSDGTRKVLSIRSDLDWMYVYNYTQLAQATADRNAYFYWQRGMTSGGGVFWRKLGAVANDPLTMGALTAGYGFTLLNEGYSSGVSAQLGNSTQVGPAVAFTATSNNVNPQITTGSTATLQTGDVVRLYQTAIDADDLLGIDFQITVNDGTHFTITNALQQAPGAGGTNGFWRRVTVGNTFYPEARYIVNISVANPLAPVVTTSVDHGYVVGQLVTFNVPSSLNGMTQIDNLSAPITAVTASTFTVDLDTTGFSAFVFPTIAQVGAVNGNYTPAKVVPAGEDTASALVAVPQANILSDAFVNQAIIGMVLGGAGGSATAAQDGPAGANNDVMYWVAGKSFSVSNS